ncbi:MAG: CAP domain-containing protein [Candidatus Dormibacteria bacterium]
MPFRTPHPALAAEQAAAPRLPRERGGGSRLEAVTATATAVRRRGLDPATPGGRRTGAVVALAGLALGGGLTALSGPAHPGSVAAMATADSQLFTLTNQDRTSNGVPALQWHSTLGAIAENANYGGCGFNVQGRAQDMINRNYFAHPILNCGQYAWSIYSAYGIQWQSAGENIAWNTYDQATSVSSANTAFMNSPEHRANILNAAFTHLGVGSANSGANAWTGGGGAYTNTSMYVEDFAQLAAGAAPPPPPPAPLSNASAAVQGTDNGVYQAQNGSFSSLNGATLAAPAVVAAPANTGGNQLLYVVTGTDHRLWVRSAAIGWQPLSGGPTYCLTGPAAFINNGNLTVSCEGGDRAMWVASGPAPSAGLPTVGSFGSAGGILADSPAMAVVAGQTTALVQGLNNHIWLWTPASGYQATPWSCIGHPALKSTNGVAYFGCQGTDRALWWSRNAGSGWSAAQSAGGQLIDGPGVAVQNGAATFFVEGTDRQMWQNSIAAGGGASGYSPRGGILVHGAGADGF